MGETKFRTFPYLLERALYESQLRCYKRHAMLFRIHYARTISF